MGDLTINVTKWYHLALALAPVISLIIVSVMWVDVRYLHKEIADNRFIELQIKIAEGHIQDYHRFIDSGGKPSPLERMKYESDADQLKKLIDEKNKNLGIGNIE